MTITSNLRFLYIFDGSGLLCGGRTRTYFSTKVGARDWTDDDNDEASFGAAAGCYSTCVNVLHQGSSLQYYVMTNLDGK